MTLGDVARQRRLMRALLGDEEALRGFIASAVIAEVVSAEGELLRKALGVDSDEQVLRPVTESLGGEDTLFFEEACAGGVFDEQIELLLYSTPVECLGVWLTRVARPKRPARPLRPQVSPRPPTTRNSTPAPSGETGVAPWPRT